MCKWVCLNMAKMVCTIGLGRTWVEPTQISYKQEGALSGDHVSCVALFLQHM